MTQYGEKLSAFLDGELPEAEAREIEQALERDPALLAELEALVAVDESAKIAFDAELSEPVPFELAAAIQNAPTAVAANTPTAPKSTGWLTAIAACAALLIGGAGGYFTGASQGTQVAAGPSWLADIADYHRVYSGQKRHLVEVGADEADHIQTWLSASIGAEVRIPDLSSFGLTFQGARLLVAAGKPVSQLMYLDAQGRVVALCQIGTETPRTGFGEQTINAFDMVSWGGDGANFVIVGDTGRGDLDQIALAASVDT
ncbi:MAG: anti-sigma factor [Paracoccaceae bacterium]|uniref:anti-sigma factor family protein n=1 Tax=Sulfitobacter pontiacus TaxID=60137 RepID=UPI00328303DC